MSLNLTNIVWPAWANPKFFLYLALGLVLAIGSYTVIKSFDDPFGFEARQEQKLETEAALAKGDVITEKGKGAYARDAVVIRQKAYDRDTKIGENENETARQLEETDGSDVILPDAFVDTLNAGLCKYESNSPCPSDSSN